MVELSILFLILVIAVYVSSTTILAFSISFNNVLTVNRVLENK